MSQYDSTAAIYKGIDAAQVGHDRAEALLARGDLRNASETSLFTRMRLGKILTGEDPMAFGEPRECMVEASEMMTTLADQASRLQALRTAESAVAA